MHANTETVLVLVEEGRLLERKSRRRLSSLQSVLGVTAQCAKCLSSLVTNGWYPRPEFEQTIEIRVRIQRFILDSAVSFSSSEAAQI